MFGGVRIGGAIQASPPPAPSASASASGAQPNTIKKENILDLLSFISLLVEEDATISTLHEELVEDSEHKESRPKRSAEQNNFVDTLDLANIYLPENIESQVTASDIAKAVQRHVLGYPLRTEIPIRSLQEPIRDVGSAQETGTTSDSDPNVKGICKMLAAFSLDPNASKLWYMRTDILKKLDRAVLDDLEKADCSKLSIGKGGTATVKVATAAEQEKSHDPIDENEITTETTAEFALVWPSNAKPSAVDSTSLMIALSISVSLSLINAQSCDQYYTTVICMCESVCSILSSVATESVIKRYNNMYTSDAFL